MIRFVAIALWPARSCIGAGVLFSLILLGSIAMLFGQVAEKPAQGSSSPNYKIGPGDVIDVVVAKNETLSRGGLRVGNDGTIQLPMLDDNVVAACMTERQLADSIKERYRKYLISPFVNVAVREFNASPVVVIGAVNSPGRFQLQREFRLLELLALVNGPSSAAGPSVEILRYGNLAYCDGANLVTPTKPKEDMIAVQLEDAFGGSDAANPIIMAGDIVRVSVADQLNAYIQGLVNSPMAIPLKGQVSLTQAIAMAGGVTSGAQLDKVLIRRPIPGSINRSAIAVNVKDIRLGKRDDVLLEPNDIVEIAGPTGVRKIFNDIVKTVVPTVTQLPLRVIY